MFGPTGSPFAVRRSVSSESTSSRTKKKDRRDRVSAAFEFRRPSVPLPRPLLPQPPRRVRAEDANDEIDRGPHDCDLDRQPDQPAEHAEHDTEQAEHEPENEQAADGEQADHENGA